MRIGWLLLAILSGFGVPGSSLVADESPLAQFKRLAEPSNCTIPRPDRAGTDPSELSDFDARMAYNCARSRMLEIYARSGHPVAQEYANWANFSTSPYRSANHEGLYVHNYANPEAARGYTDPEAGETFPVGAILAKDSFFLDDGQIMIGALSIMRKMPRGYNRQYNDWEYTLILPDGAVFATTTGVQSPQVRFCGGCHRASGIRDSLFFVPERYRFGRD
jgi:hypothetical protein